MAKPRIELNHSGIHFAGLSSSEVRAALRSVAEGIVGRARSYTDHEIVIRDGGRSRARVYVVRRGSIRTGSGAAGEAADRALGRSIGGA